MRGLLSALASAAVLVAGTAWSGEPAADGKDHLVYRRTYAEALTEARIRNVPVFVSRHKDG